MKKILILGYNQQETKIYRFIKNFDKNIAVYNSKKKLKLKYFMKFDLILSFGYRHIIDKFTIKKLQRPIINLHMSYLPYNRGSHPNFWSFMEGTPSGVTIHEVNDGIDTGKIIAQKKINFKLKKNSKITFFQSYKILFNELEKLFLKNLKSLITGNYKTRKQPYSGTIHYKNELPRTILKKWSQNIAKTIVKYKTYLIK